MILWTIKLILRVRRAIAGREHPSQLAWGVALGALVGLIPHGNLLALVLVLLVLTLRVNHAMVALVAVGVMFAAPQLDPTFDSFGRWFFEQPRVASSMAAAWQYPLVPWTDLNNTVVMGSFLIGLIALVPLYLIMNPLFRAWAKNADDAEPVVKVKRRKQAAKSELENSNQTLHRVDSNHSTAAEPHFDYQGESSEPMPVQPSAEGAPALATSGRVYDVRRVDAAPIQAVVAELAKPELVKPEQLTSDATSTASVQSVPPPHSPRTTRISIGTTVTAGKSAATRSAIHANAVTQQNKLKKGFDPERSSVDDQHKIDEALSYLLRQLRDSQDKDAA